MLTIKRNISLGLVIQSIGIIASFILIPASIKYLGEMEYGYWLVIYAYYLLINSCDLGVSSSARNEITKYLSLSQMEEAKKIVKTTHIILLLISAAIFSISFLISEGLAEKTLSFVSKETIVIILAIAIIDFNVKFSHSIYYANHHSYIGQLSNCLINCASLIIISSLLIVKNIYKISIEYFILIYPICSVTVNLGIYIYCYYLKFSFLRPTFNTGIYKKNYVLIYNGLGFFVIQISMAILTQYTSIVIFKNSSGDVLANVSVAEKYFGIISLISATIMFPFWSRFTEKNSQKDYVWISRVLRKMEYISLVFFVCICVMYALYPYVIKILFIDSTKDIDKVITILIATKFFLITLNSVYSYFLNALNFLKIQVTIYGVSALFFLGVSGLDIEISIVFILLYINFVYLVMAFFQKLKTIKYLSEMQNG